MSTQTLKDAQYRIIGYIDTHGNGSQTGKTAQYKIVGYYDPRTNVTKDASYHIVGYGNQIASLIHCS